MRWALTGLTVSVAGLAIAVALLAGQVGRLEGRLTAQMNGLETRLGADMSEVKEVSDNMLVEVAIVQAQVERVYEVARATGTMLMIHMKKAGTWPGELR